MLTLEQAKAWYVSNDSVHDFEHVERVYRMAERLAQAENADLEIVRAAALLHDSQGTTPGSEARKEHQIASAEFAGQVLAEEGWPADRIAAVQHCIRAHRFRSKDERPETLEAQCLFDADKLDVLGAIGVARVVAYATLAGEPIFFWPSEHFLQTGQQEPGEPHSAYHEFLFKLRKIKDRLFTPTAREIAEERHQYLAEYFSRLEDEILGKR